MRGSTAMTRSGMRDISDSEHRKGANTWWRKPPKELTQVLPIEPDVRTCRYSPGEPFPRDTIQRAFRFAYTLTSPKPKEATPDIATPWNWMNTYGTVGNTADLQTSQVDTYDELENDIKNFYNNLATR